jgi:hypothetical protein
MFRNINIEDYDLDWDLQKACFFRDCLKRVFKFSIENDKLVHKKIIYSEKDSQKTTKEINVDLNDIIYFIHIVLPRYIDNDQYMFNKERDEWIEKKDNIKEEERDEWIDKNPFTPNVDPRPANAFKNLFSDIEKLKLTIKCVYILLKIEKRKEK